MVQITGWPRKEFFDSRDKYYVPKAYFDLAKMSPLNLRTHVDYGKNFAKPYNQTPQNTSLDGNCWGTCAANATAAAFIYEWNRQGLPALDPSRLFIYFFARKLAYGAYKQDSDNPESKAPNKQGSHIRLNFKALDQYGVSSEREWGYDDRHLALEPTPKILKSALSNHSVQYSRLDPDQPEGVEDYMTLAEKDIIGAMTLLRLRQCLGEGYPVVFGFRYYWEYAPFTKDTKDPNTKYWTLPPLPGKSGPSEDFGGHAVLAIGFDDGNSRILCQNSWGEAGEGAPYFWIGYDWIKDFEATSDFWMIRVVEKK